MSKSSWDKLSMRDKAAMIKVAVESGVYNLDDIRGAYNEYAEGGDTNNQDDVSWWGKLGLSIADGIGLSKRYKGKDDDVHYRQNLYNVIDPTLPYPQKIKDIRLYKAKADYAMLPDSTYEYQRVNHNPASDAAWAKRLGLLYNKNILIDNSDGSVHLSDSLEREIPVDTLFLKDRIKQNEKVRQYYRNMGAYNGDRRKVIEEGLKRDQEALDALRKTYKTGEPVVINENSHVSRKWIRDGVPGIEDTPLNLMQNFTIRYNKDKNEMEYWDTYDFNMFENFVPGEPFKIKGSFKLNK